MNRTLYLALMAGLAAPLALSPLAAQTRPSTLPSLTPPATTLPGRPVQPIQPLPEPVPPPGWHAGSYFAGTTRCESQNHRPRSCRAQTQNRVRSWKCMAVRARAAAASPMTATASA